MFKSKDPSPRPLNLRWSYRKIAPGTDLHAWLAGPYCGVPTHWSKATGRSHPCRSAITDGLLACSFCQSESKTRWIGYQPLYAEPGAQIVVALSETVAPLVKEITGQRGSLGLGAWVRFFRTAGARDPLRISQQPTKTGSTFPVTLSRRGPQDLWPWLMQLWQDAELASAFEASKHLSQTGT